MTTAVSRTKNKVLLLQVKQEDEAAAVEADWKFAAMVSNITIRMLLLLLLLLLTRVVLQVIDRLCLIVYTLFTIIASVTVIWTAPHVIVA